ncbi:GAF and ANTAR domain-containing protein [Paenarthrobacter sp. GOM3]|uniref:GAF and ANTAR domain-containing protein n=1 Tax=Paenarthrobacter sp. GOM3 TaxID=2782567 RepID=UPI001BAA44DB|nr:GAF and ANTAR domain-containing protein [Paenarthrobacter sp. GOM3]WOH18694.1 GAF and ANTAR domain-containing protein [Paenarthrobacter sp. GOM3]
MGEGDWAEDFEQLVDLIAGTEDVKAFLDGLTGFAAGMMTRVCAAHIECAVTLRRRKRTATIGGSSERALILDRIEQSLGSGPCVDALDSGVPVLLGDVDSDPRWPEYRKALAAAGVKSALGVPMTLGDDSAAVLNFFAPEPGLFTEQAISDAVLFVEMASKAMRLAIRLAAAHQRGDDLKAAMDTRTVIDLACGMIMAQNRCTQEEAFDVLRRASSDRNQKLHSVAQSMVDRISGQPDAVAHFDD